MSGAKPMIPLSTTQMYGMPCYFCGLPVAAQEVYETGVRIVHAGSGRSCAHRFIPLSISSPVDEPPKRWAAAIPVMERPKRKAGRPKEKVA